MKTLEFKIYPNKTQQQTIDRWIETLRLVWNWGLELLIELDAYSAPYVVMVKQEGELKKTYHRAPCCPIGWEYRWMKGKRWEFTSGKLDIIEGASDTDWAAIPYSRRASRRPYRMFCPLIPTGLDDRIWEEPSPFAYKEPRLDNPSNFSLAKFFAHKRHPDWQALNEIPAWFIRGTCHSLANAWDRYKSKKGGLPRFKRKGDAVDTLIHEDASKLRIRRVDEKGREVAYLQIPKLGEFKVKYFAQDWNQDVPVKVLKLCRQPDAYYLQMTGNLPVKPPKVSTRTAGLALPQAQGILYVDDRGKMVEAIPEDLKLLLRLEKLQQQLARQEYLSKNWHKTKNKIARLYRRAKLRARNHNHKLSTFVVRKFNEIAIQDVKAGAIPSPEPIVEHVEPPKYAPNGATQVSLINQRRTAMRTGQFVALIQQKAKSAGKTVIKIKPKKNAKQTNPAKIAASIKPKD
jgi:putative transposase